jgi:TolB protein
MKIPRGFYRNLLFSWVALSPILSLQIRAQSTSAIPESMPTGHITFMSMRDGNFEIYRMSATGEMVTNLSRNPALDYWASYSPSGQELYFYSKRDGRDQIYRMDAEGQHQVSLSPSSFNDRLPTVAPDGQSIVFLSDRDSPEGELYIMEVDGRNVKRLTTNEVTEDVATWAPNGKKIIYARDARSSEEIAAEMEGNFELFSIRRDGRKEKKLTVFPGFCAAPVFSPDGKRIAFYGRGDEGTLDIFTMKPNGSGLKEHNNGCPGGLFSLMVPGWKMDRLYLRGCIKL